MKNPFLKEPNPEEVDDNGLLVANMIEHTKAEIKTQRLINTLSVLAIGTTLGVLDGFSSNERIVTYYVVPAIFNGVMTIRSEAINRRHIRSLKKIGPEIKAEGEILRDALNDAGIPIPEVLQVGGLQRSIQQHEQ